MSEAADPWAPGRDEGPTATPSVAPDEPGKLPDVMKLFTAVLEDLMKHFVDYLLAGLGVMLPAFVLTFGLVLGALFLGFVPMILGAALDEPELGSLAGMVVMVGATFAAAFLASAITAPLQASLGRALVEHQFNGEKLGFGSAYSRITQDLPVVLGLTFAQIGLTLLGAMMCYFPALIVAWALSFALPAVIVHRMGVVAAIKRSFEHTFANPLWHLGFFALGFAILVVGQNVPLIGPLVSIPFWMAYTIRGYLAAYPR